MGGLVPWRRVMALGLGVLRLAPADFWAMTPRELERAAAGALGEGASIEPLGRADFEALMRRYPDGRRG